MQVAIVKYNAGNIYSVDCALRRVGITPILTDDKEALMAADKVIFPGVGEAATTMTYLREQGLDRLIRDLRQPVWEYVSVCNSCAAIPKREIPIVSAYSMST